MPPIKHIFYDQLWESNNEIWRSEKAILTELPYNPEVLFLGTFNPEQPGNTADFYYGRNYFWPIIFNIFQFKHLAISKKRESKGSPSIHEILRFMKNYRLTFADLISQVLHSIELDYQWKKRIGRGRSSMHLYIGSSRYNLINDTKRTKNGEFEYGLDNLDSINQVDWNTKAIIKYLRSNESIKTVYITCNPSNSFLVHWNMIRNKKNYNQSINFRRIYTPSGQRTPEGHDKIKFVLKDWVNGSKNFEGLDNNWLTRFITKEELSSLKTIDSLK